MDFLSIDTEFTSFYSPDDNKCGDLLQLGVVAVRNGEVVGSFNECCRPLGKVWNSHAEAIHKIPKKMAMTFQHPEEMMKKFFTFVEQFDCKFTCLGWNCTGDKNYMNKYVRKYGGNANNWYKRIRMDWRDTKIRASARKKSLLGLKNYKLETVAKFFGVEINAHDALSDAYATWKIDELLNQFKPDNAKSVAQVMTNLTEIEKRDKYLDAKYCMLDGDGTIYITPFASKNPEALRVIMEEIWSLYVESDD